MNKIELKKVNKIKLILKNNNKYNEYKLLFKNKQIRFLFSKISIIFESSVSNDDLANLELSLLNNPTKDNFIISIEKLSKTFNEKFIDLSWKNLGVSLWYTFQTSLFYNKKRKIPCEYTTENFISLNNIKRNNYSKWLKSFYDTKNIDFNKYVIEVLENII